MKVFKQAQIKNKKVLLRIDFNVPLTTNDKRQTTISDDSRIRAALPTIEYLINHGAAKIILLSHLGRPKGKFVSDLSLWPIANHLSKLLKSSAKFSGPQKEYQIADKIILLENIRFEPGEEKNDPVFAKKLAGMADSPRGEAGIFVNDAFSCIHRGHASTEGIIHFLPSFTGFQMEKEIENLSKILNPNRPFVCIMGGAKAKDKIGVIENLAGKTDYFLLAGVIANTFLKAKGEDIKSSTVVDEMLDTAKKFLEKYKEKITLSEYGVYGDLNGRRAILDIGKKDIKIFDKYIKKARTIFWNGNLGMTEKPEFANGSSQIARSIVASKAFTVAGGGDTVAFINSIGLAKKFSFLSLAGGAALEFLAGKKLPGLSNLL